MGKKFYLTENWTSTLNFTTVIFFLKNVTDMILVYLRAEYVDFIY